MKFLTLIFLFIGTTLFAQDDWQVFETDEYTIKYPQEWVSSDEKPQPTMQFLLLSSEESQLKDEFRENINLNIEALGSNPMNIEEYTQSAIDQVKAYIPSAKVVSNSVLTDNENLGAEIIWSANFGDDMNLKFKQIYSIRNGIAYVLTYSSTEEEFDQYYDIANEIMNSFTFKN